MKRLLVVATILCTVVLIIPAVIIVFLSDPAESTTTVTRTITLEELESEFDYNPEADVAVTVFRTESEQLEETPLERYVMGVVASEMHASFEMEALKAQALTARTYMVKNILQPRTEQLPEGAMVTDTVTHQVYKNEEELKELWGSDYDMNMARIQEAVLATQGQVLTFEGEPIDALFFSTSNGYTENSEDYWGDEIPYLRSVESPWDQVSPRFSSEITMSVADFQEKLKVNLPEDGSVGTILERTQGGRVAKVRINDEELSGREVRDRLGLDSSDFQWQRQGDQIAIQTRGWGHGVGMSQFGADGMAKEGSNYADIINHYYNGVEIQSVEPFVSEMLAKAE
ncbi:stage II sporulation protein D [Halalkalibacter wakoensis JCM 9140]|uniref:Stage II sporulation protein D n=1 Tax=Halalkalibacter wakoensis JCM 9140 TaxID=1236970 RepID=W4Q5K9_9BACI|nr:stage II sporulation protein D [Halalkalibacter wakoensis]GAE27245.1 stage II sporulation protein D [Halalkalibacter wakoensis JCM 9140]